MQNKIECTGRFRCGVLRPAGSSPQCDIGVSYYLLLTTCSFDTTGPQRVLRTYKAILCTTYWAPESTMS